MAKSTSMKSQRTQTIVGIRRLGKSQLELLHVEAPPPEWIAVAGPAGEEVARVLVTPGHCLGNIRQAQTIAWRPLTESERRAIRQHVLRASRLVPRVIEALAQAAPEAQFNEVRPTLSDGIVIGIWSQHPLPTQLGPWLSSQLSQTVVIEEQAKAPSHIGSVGLPHDETQRECEQALARLFARHDYAQPHYPRLGSWVETPNGPGRVLRVDTRDAAILIQDNEGRQVMVPATHCRPVSSTT
ncbi:hypothetical protein [Thermorudis peleae]|uniref:hypothetical protein n=1 Tax=Thermorudis peleae TaxID=1382356 RepID=UPI0012E083D9|nr:hypothetical protein [Thermorudis peleae]